MVTMSKKNVNRTNPAVEWEQAEFESYGMYARNIEALASRFPVLTPMELRVCALVKTMLPNKRIGELLAIDERTVENHRTNIRRKLKICKDNTLVAYLASCAAD